jgi:hypothetical protein
MNHWTLPMLASVIEQFDRLPPKRHAALLDYFNINYPPHLYNDHKAKRNNALKQMNNIRAMLNKATQHFPSFITSEQLSPSAAPLEDCAIVFTAGGEGERLRLSLQKKGYPASTLENFTKATFALPGFDNNFGTLPINLIMVASLCKKYTIDIPVVITTGPAGSVTATVIPEILAKFNNFGLKHIRVIAQDERLFLTNDEHVVLQEINGELRPITHPDETGGPLMKLKSIDASTGTSLLQWFESIGCSKTIIVQATALYHQTVLPLMAAALGDHDCLGTGILRKTFPASDPYGTYVSLQTDNKSVTMILEQDVRNDATRTVIDGSGKFFLPFNTGFYAFQNALLRNSDLPNFATPPKEILPDLPRAPKIGYAATDLITLSKNPIILAIDASMFGVLKNADDLETLSEMGRAFGLQKLCKSF